MGYTRPVMEDLIIIGAGAVGAFIARSLSRYELSVLVIEKENDVGDVTSMANSAIAHSGYDPEPGTKKAIFNVAGNKMFPQLAKELDVNFGQVGTMTVAVEDEQIPMLNDLLERAKKNGVPAKLLTAEEVKKAEPNINPEVKGALLCPTGGIVNPFTLVSHAMENAMDNGVKLALDEEVLSVEKTKNGYKVKTDKQKRL
jgi:glycerol-3-phosphate dehydrogenase